MEIEELTMEQAKEIFYSEKGQQSWKITERLVGPPVEFAYQNDYIAKLLLCGTWGSILVRRDKILALEGIASLEKHCDTTYDKAVWLLTKGTYFEVFENHTQASVCYEEAADNYPGTYVVYFRMAKIAYNAEDFETAEKYCQQGLSYLRKDELYGQEVLKEIEVQFMGFLDEILKKNTAKKRNKEKNTPGAVSHEKSLTEIWMLEDPSDFVIALSQYIGEKCQYGEKMSVLSEPERVFYVGQLLEMEVNNGGFAQFFFNFSGDFANEIVSAFTKIGAVKTAEICKKAVSIYDGEVPADRDEREDVFVDDEELEAILEECDDAFFAYEEDLNALNYEYVMRNKMAFS